MAPGWACWSRRCAPRSPRRRPPAGSRAGRRGRALRSPRRVRLRRTGGLRRPPGQDRHDRARPGHPAPGVVSLRGMPPRVRAPRPAAGGRRGSAVAGPGRDDRPGRRRGPVRPRRRPAGRAWPAITMHRQDASSGPPRPAARPPRARPLRRPPRSAPARSRRCRPREPVPDMLYVEVDGTGVPVRARETEGRQRQGRRRQGRHPRGQARPAVHRVRLNDDGRPVMDPGSSTYACHLRRQGRPRRPGGGRVPAAAAASTSGRSSPSATARPGSGPWPRRSTRTPPTSWISTTPESTCTIWLTGAWLLAGHRDDWLAARLEELDAGDVQAILNAGRDRRSMRSATASRLSAVKAHRPAAMTTNGSTGAASVQAAGSENNSRSASPQ